MLVTHEHADNLERDSLVEASERLKDTEMKKTAHQGKLPITAEHSRLDDAREKNIPWKKWGPYLSERQWGTVREDYSGGGDAWSYFTHDQARSRAYRC